MTAERPLLITPEEAVSYTFNYCNVLSDRAETLNSIAEKMYGKTKELDSPSLRYDLILSAVFNAGVIQGQRQERQRKRTAERN